MHYMHLHTTCAIITHMPCAYFRPDTFSSMKLTTVLPNTMLEKMVNSPAIAVMGDIALSVGPITVYKWKLLT